MVRSRPTLALLGFAAVVLAQASACASGPEVTPEPAPAPATASTSAQPSANTEPATIMALAVRPQRLAAPVAVVASPAEPVACEQMCARVGDCLGERDALEASALELSCLDLCVNVREDAPVAAKFHACEGRDSCEGLLSCAEQHWEETRLARVQYDPLVDAAAVNACDAYCTGVYGCMYYDKTVAQGLEFTESTQREVDSCIAVCDSEDPIMQAAAPCSSELTCMDYWSCLERSQNGGRW